MCFGELLLIPVFVGVFRQHRLRHLYTLKEQKAAPVSSGAISSYQVSYSCSLMLGR